MSYSAIAGNKNSFFSYEPTTPMPLDIQAIQSIYGPNNTSSGDDNYFFDDTQTYHETIWDSGGATDWIVYSGFQDSTIDLREGMGSSIGKPVYVEYVNITNVTQVFNVWIAYDTVIENASGGSGNDFIEGNDADNTLNGGDGNDQLYGGSGNDYIDWDPKSRGGADAMYGGPGDDVYVLDSSFDTVIELPGEGVDTVWVSETYSIANVPWVENLSLIDGYAINATGNNLANVLRGNDQNNILLGNSGDDSLDGGNGNDDLDGGVGNDQLYGGIGNDILRAGYGQDTLYGSTGNDTFGFYALGHFQVSDFTTGEDHLFFDSSQIGVNNLHDLVGYITDINQKNDGVIVEFGSSASIELAGINLNTITADMIVFSL